MPATAWIALASLLFVIINLALGYSELSAVSRSSKQVQRLQAVYDKASPVMRRGLQAGLRRQTAQLVVLLRRPALTGVDKELAQTFGIGVLTAIGSIVQATDPALGPVDKSIIIGLTAVEVFLQIRITVRFAREYRQNAKS